MLKLAAGSTALPGGWLALLIAIVLGALALALAVVSLRGRHGPGQADVACSRRGLEQWGRGHRDALTGLANRQGFVDAVATRLRERPASALLLFDLDGFAAINAAHGHRAADELLVGVAGTLRTLMPDGPRTGRLGGDTFGVLLDAGPGADSVEAVCLRLMRAMAGVRRVGTEMLACDMSLGVAVAPAHGADADALLAAAQAALGEARAAGGGAWRMYAAERQLGTRLRTSLASELPDALAGGLIVPRYQPVIALATGAVAGLEVRAGWEHPSHGPIEAERFMPIAEGLGLAALLTERLMRAVMADMRDLPPGLRFAFTVWPEQLRALIGMAREPPIWPEGMFDPARIAIEVTERALLDDMASLREVMAVLRARGTQVMLGGFGTGAGNLAHLRDLPFDMIKIDPDFAARVADDPRAAACVRSMLELGRSLRIDAVADGVHSAEVAAWLADLGCRFGQGFLYGGPVPGRDVRGLLRRLAGTRQPGRGMATALVCDGAPSN